MARARAAGFFLLVLGGDCPTSLGTLAGLLTPEETAIVWFDAHGDFNTPDISISGYLGGMALACAAGHGLGELRAATKLNGPIAERNVALLGARDLDPLEERALLAWSVMLVRTEGFAGDRAEINHAIHALGRRHSFICIWISMCSTRAKRRESATQPLAGCASTSSRKLCVRSPGWATWQLSRSRPSIPEKDVDGRTAAAGLDVIETVFTRLREHSAWLPIQYLRSVLLAFQHKR